MIRRVIFILECYLAYEKAWEIQMDGQSSIRPIHGTLVVSQSFEDDNNRYVIRYGFHRFRKRAKESATSYNTKTILDDYFNYYCRF